MDDFRTLRQLIVGWLLLLVALIPMNAQNGNVLGQVIRLPKSKGNIYPMVDSSRNVPAIFLYTTVRLSIMNKQHR